MRSAYCLILAAGLISSSCTHRRQSDTARYPLRGAVVLIDTSAMTVMVAHQAIADYMGAMTMSFRVKDPREFGTLEVGDSIAATLVVSQSESYLEGIHSSGTTGVTMEPSGHSPGFPPIGPGETIVDVPLINQDGALIHMSDFRGRVLALTFIYTRCPLPDFCIRMSENFSEIQKMLEGDRAIAGKWHLLSISFDARFDRPEILARYGALYGAHRAMWELATDPDTSGASLRALAQGLGLGYQSDEGLYAHNLRTALIDADGRLVSVTSGNAWTAHDLASEIRRLLR